MVEIPGVRHRTLGERFRVTVRYLVRFWPVSTLASIWYLFVAAALALDSSLVASSSLVRYVAAAAPGGEWWAVSAVLVASAAAGLWFALSDSRAALFATVIQQLVMVATLSGIAVAVATGTSASGDEVSRQLLLVSFMPIVLIITFHAVELVTLMRWRFRAGRYR